MCAARASLSVEVALCLIPRFISPDSLYGVLRLCGSTGGTRGAKARERRVWTPYRGHCASGGARGVCSWARLHVSRVRF